MIKIIKIKNRVYENIEPFIIDEDGEKVWMIPETLEELRTAAIDTYNWLIGNEVKRAAGDIVKLSASNSKAILLLYKLIKNSVEINTSSLTATEKSILLEFDKLLENEYTDSELLLNTIKTVNEKIAQYSQTIEKIIEAKDYDELLKILSEEG